MEILKIVAIALTRLILAIVTKSVNREISIYIVLATVMILFLSVAGRLTKIFGFLQGIYDNVTYGRAFFPVILKVLAVAYITRLHRSTLPGRGKIVHRFQGGAGGKDNHILPGHAHPDGHTRADRDAAGMGRSGGYEGGAGLLAAWTPRVSPR